MKNKGFTMVELVAIIAILAAIFLVSFPILTSMQSKNKENDYEVMVKNLCEAGRSYIYSNTSNYPELSIEDSEITVNISDLVTYGNVSSDQKNPKTGQSILSDSLTFTVSTDSYLRCEYNDN